MKKLVCILIPLVLAIVLCSCDTLGGLGTQTTEEDSTVTTKRDRYDDEEDDEDEDEDYDGGEYSSSSETEGMSSPPFAYPTETVVPSDTMSPSYDWDDTTLIKFDGVIYVGVGANLREEPNASSKKLGTAVKGDVFKATGENNNWYEIVVDGVTCYITKQAAVDKSVMDSFVDTNDIVVVTAETNLNLRSLPSAKATLVTYVPNSTVLYRIAVGDGWSKILYTNKDGEMIECYVSNKYIKPLTGETTTEEAETVSPILEEIENEINSESVYSFSETESKTEHVKISFKNYGDVVIRLRPDIAPITVANFQYLVADGFYDGLTMHRIIKDFMIQGGNGASAGRYADTIKGEFAANGIKNPISHVPGVISMARTPVYDSASSQFFIVSGPDALHLDGYYAGFGYVVAGLDVIYQIQNVETNRNDAPIMDVVIGDVCFVTK